MLCVFPITLTEAAKRYVDRLFQGTVNSWDVLKKAFIQRYCSSSKIAKQLEDIHNFKQEGDETLYQTWERYNDLLYKCPTHDINSHQKVDIFYNGLGIMNRHLLDSQRLIPSMTPAQALIAIQTMVTTPKSVTMAPIDKTPNEAQVAQKEDDVQTKVLPFQLPPKELKGSFTLPCTIGNLDFYAITDLGASVNVIPKSMFETLKLANLKETDMLVEMADMTKRTPIGIVENILVKIDKFLFPSDFVIMDMLRSHNETMILSRQFLATIHAEIDVFNKEISLGIGDDRITFDMDKRNYNFTTPLGKVYMVNSILDDESPDLLDVSSRAPSIESRQIENLVTRIIKITTITVCKDEVARREEYLNLT
nr:hypothetical protein [Tanacetum cinerariifolium]